MSFRVTSPAKNSDLSIKTNIEQKQSSCSIENKQQTISTEIYIVIRIYLS